MYKHDLGHTEDSHSHYYHLFDGKGISYSNIFQKTKFMLTIAV